MWFRIAESHGDMHGRSTVFDCAQRKEECLKRTETLQEDTEPYVPPVIPSIGRATAHPDPVPSAFLEGFADGQAFVMEREFFECLLYYFSLLS